MHGRRQKDEMASSPSTMHTPAKSYTCDCSTNILPWNDI